jgi:protease-4
MNLTNISQKLENGKWMMSQRDFHSFARSIEKLQELRVGGLYGMLMGKPVVLSQSGEINIIEEEKTEGDIAVVQIQGILMKGANEEECECLGLCNTDYIAQEIKELAYDPSIKSIILWINSPGGECVGIEELGRLIKNINKEIKPIYGWTEGQVGSAAYWLISQSEKIGMTYSADCGSVGVYMMILDESKQMENEGVKITAISSGKFKMMGHAYKPLTEEEQIILQKDVNKQHEQFKNVILEARPNVNLDALEGLSYDGLTSLEHNLVDVVTDNFEEFLTEITN